MMYFLKMPLYSDEKEEEEEEETDIMLSLHLPLLIAGMWPDSSNPVPDKAARKL